MNNYSERLGTSEHDKKWRVKPRTWKSGRSIDPWTPWLHGPWLWISAEVQ